MACGITSDFIYKMLQSAEKEEPEAGCQSIYDLLFQEGKLKKAETGEESGSEVQENHLLEITT